MVPTSLSSFNEIESKLRPKLSLKVRHSVSLDSLNIAFWGRFLPMFTYEWLNPEN